MNFLPLSLGIRKVSDAESGAKNRQEQLREKSEKTLKRDDFTCRFCGFRSTQFQRVIPWSVKGDLPYVTACTFCEQCVFLDRAGAMGSGHLIWLPEISQLELNHLMRAIYIARAAKPPNAVADAESDGKKPRDKAEAPPEDPHHDMTAAATRAYNALMGRRSDAKRRLGSDDPMLLSTIMHESLSPDELKKIGSKIEGIKFISLEKYLTRSQKGNVNQFPRMVQFWQSASGPYAKYPVDKWAEMFRSAVAGVGNA